MGNTDSHEKKPVVEDASTTMYNLTFSHVISQYLYIVAKLDVATIILEAEKPLTADEIAKQHGGTINVDYLQRILRLLSSTNGIFKEVRLEGDTLAFELTDLSRLLTSATQMPHRSFIINHLDPVRWRAWSRSEECVMSEESLVPFRQDNGMGVFEFFKNNPEESKVFNNTMTSSAQDAADTLLSFYCEGWKKMSEKEATVLDVGGGHGLIMRQIKQQYPKLKCKVVDLKEVIDSAPEEECGIDFIAGDFFKSDTLPKSDVILMTRILHDWNDDDSKKILESCHVALSEGGKLIICEAVLPSFGDTVKKQGLNPFLLDAHMMTVTSGRERTAADWKKLLENSKFKLEKIIETPITMRQIIEGRKL